MPSFALQASFTTPSQKWRRRGSRRLRIRAAGSGDGPPPHAKPTENGTLAAKASEVVAQPKETAKQKSSKPVQAKPIVTKSPNPIAKTFQNKMRFVVPASIRSQFDAEWNRRRDLMEKCKGFRTLKIEEGPRHDSDAREVRVVSEWVSIPDWEAYACSVGARRSHLPPGVYQYVPKKGEGFPEDFTPFVDYEAAVIAKY